MQTLWNDEEASRYQGDLALRVYTSRLLGRDRSLVLHGGGNTSVKIRERNLLGDEEEILYVKGSGWDLETIEADGFSPVRLDHLRRLAQLPSLPDPQMVNELVTHLTRASAPVPSIEAILHAILPFRYVDHTHADAVVAVTNTPDGESHVREIYGDSVIIIPYVMPGFDLARICAEIHERDAGPETIGMVLMNHGIFSFGESARQSYERMIDLVSRAECFLEKKGTSTVSLDPSAPDIDNVRTEIAALRKDISTAAGAPMLLRRSLSRKGLAFARRADVARISQQGPATPDHVIRTKRIPMLGRDVQAYVAAYRKYFDEHRMQAKEAVTMLDPAPRVVLDPALGLLSVGRSAKDAAIIEDIYDHTIDVIMHAEAAGGYRALPAKELFDVEYWDLEQAKLKKGGRPPLFAGEVAVVTGAASGIGRACVESLLARGAAVVGLDIDAGIRDAFGRKEFLGVRCDVTREEEIVDALEAGVGAFGGVDMLILNAGIFPGGCRIDSLDSATWRQVMQINLDANLVLLRESHPLLACAPRGGRVVVIGSKNVPAPGPGAAAYSASKAALTQLARVAALEWGADNIRVNTLHPDAVFDTALWTDEVLAARARHYGMTVDEYKRKNLLKTEVKSRDVAELAAELCGPLFARTTGAQIPVDGGNDRVI
jgi:rhamnose utilization protein RhaD (predicted bifunctional aldolase and dehydrogenase)/NAD(P)-dependent dehydrogenase (short-subunit alcohol dehydrogenase family)